MSAYAERLSVRSSRKEQALDVTRHVREVVRKSGVRWSSPPIDSVSIRYARHSFPPATISSLPL